MFLLGALATANVVLAQGDNDEETNAQVIPNTGQLLTPTAPPGTRFEPLNPNLPNYPEYLAGRAVTTVVSPDYKTLLILTSGYNLVNYPSGSNIGQTDKSASTEYVFVYDISSKIPVKKQVIQIPNTYQGITVSLVGPHFMYRAVWTITFTFTTSPAVRGQSVLEARLTSVTTKPEWALQFDLLLPGLPLRQIAPRFS